MGRRLVKEKQQEEEHLGIQFYTKFGKIFVGCGIVFFVLFIFISKMPQDYEKYNVPLFFGIMAGISALLLLIGITVLLLCKKSKKFQVWADRDVDNFAKYLIRKEMKQRGEDEWMK
jgi:uncharacterized membrane protein